MNQISGFPLSTKSSFSVVNHLNLAPAKILIVDDNPLSRMTTVDLLSLDGYELLETDSNSSILDTITKQKTDLVLLDVMTRQIDSFALCRQLKSDRRTSQIPVVLMTLTESREHRLKGMEAGADDLLIKPLDYLELSTRVKSLINQKRLNEGLDQTEQVLFSIAKALESRSSDSGSCARMALLVQAFGNYLELTPNELNNLLFAAHLHDIGTIAIPDAVMLKEGELTASEKELIRKHVLIGEEICQPLRNRRGILPIIRHHHERWDGTGYPDGLSGKDIPYLAQVFQIIDIYDALTSDRPHKKAYSPTEALTIIAEETAKGWRNPKITEAFTAFIRNTEL